MKHPSQGAKSADMKTLTKTATEAKKNLISAFQLKTYMSENWYHEHLADNTLIGALLDLIGNMS